MSRLRAGMTLFTALIGALYIIETIPLRFNHTPTLHDTISQTHLRSFHIADDRFFLDNQPIPLISGSIHYNRIHPDQWQDRLQRSLSMGLNAIQLYVPWNLHNPEEGIYLWTGFADIERFLQMASDLNLLVLLRPGPYICAEWDYGGFPTWLSFNNNNNNSMRLRTSDPKYLAAVEEWWDRHLFPKIKPFLIQNGGPIVMVQIENEYGFCGDDHDYIRKLVDMAKRHLGPDLLYYTTDPPGVAEKGSLPGDEIFTAVDFGPGWFDPANAYKAQQRMNAPGKSPPICTEFYTGWLTHYGEKMANTSTSILADDTAKLLQYGNNSGSLNFYMVHGGTNFAFWAGANVDNTGLFMPHITSYDYDAPISEAGDYGQPGIGGDSKYDALRKVIAAHTGNQQQHQQLLLLPPVPPRPRIQVYGSVTMQDKVSLFTPGVMGDSVVAVVDQEEEEKIHHPGRMEDYGQLWGYINYRTKIQLSSNGTASWKLDLGKPVHDYGSIYVNGQLIAKVDRNNKQTVIDIIPVEGGEGGEMVLLLDIFVEAFGHQNFGCDTGSWDYKGLQSSNITLNGEPLSSQWEVFPMMLHDDPQHIATGHIGSSLLHRLPWQDHNHDDDTTTVQPPAFYKGTLHIPHPHHHHHNDIHNNATTTLPCTYLALHRWGKGVAWVNGFNLGRYWSSKGPQMTLYVPGPVLKYGDNEIVLFEIDSTPGSRNRDLSVVGGGVDHRQQQEEEEGLMVEFVNTPDFWGPRGKGERGGKEWYMRYERIVVGRDGEEGEKGVAVVE